MFTYLPINFVDQTQVLSFRDNYEKSLINRIDNLAQTCILHLKLVVIFRYRREGLYKEYLCPPTL